MKHQDDIMNNLLMINTMVNSKNFVVQSLINFNLYRYHPRLMNAFIG